MTETKYCKDCKYFNKFGWFTSTCLNNKNSYVARVWQLHFPYSCACKYFKELTKF